MAEQYEIVCLDDSESEREPENRDMLVTSSEPKEDVKIIVDSEGLLARLKHVTVIKKENEVGPRDRAFWGRDRDEDSEDSEIQIIDCKTTKPSNSNHTPNKNVQHNHSISTASLVIKKEPADQQLKNTETEIGESNRNSDNSGVKDSNEVVSEESTFKVNKMHTVFTEVE